MNIVEKMFKVFNVIFTTIFLNTIPKAVATKYQGEYSKCVLTNCKL